jgi:hypothetical protein
LRRWLKGLIDNVKRSYWTLLVLALWCVSPVDSAWACRYNVLEVGFIDLGIEPYYVFGYVDEETPGDLIATFEDRAAVALVDTNVQFELVHAGQDANHPAMRLARSHEIEAFPAAVLVSPDEQSRPIGLAGAPPTFGERVSSAFEAMLSSPKRTEILAKTAATYGVILIIEGPDAEDNKLAQEAARAAVAQVAVQMEFMPKPIANPPVVLTLEAESLSDEDVLLWSLGLAPEDVNEPCAAVFYSRGRWIGPLFRGEQITQDHLERILFVIGADCECGLDHRWLQGTMLPARWDESLQAAAAQSLDLDPESPMVKMEMISIIRRGMGGFSSPGVPFGYQEIEVGSDAIAPIEFVEEEVSEPVESGEPIEPVESVESIEPDEPVGSDRHEVVPAIPEGVVPTAQSSPPTGAQQGEVETAPRTPAIAWGLAGLAGCVMAVGIMVFMRSKKI